MRVSKTDSEPDHEDTITLEEIRESLHELERLGFVRRTGEFENGNPVYVATAECKEASSWSAQCTGGNRPNKGDTREREG